MFQRCVDCNRPAFNQSINQCKTFPYLHRLQVRRVLDLVPLRPHQIAACLGGSADACPTPCVLFPRSRDLPFPTPILTWQAAPLLQRWHRRRHRVFGRLMVRVDAEDCVNWRLPRRGRAYPVCVLGGVTEPLRSRRTCSYSYACMTIRFKSEQANRASRSFSLWSEYRVCFFVLLLLLLGHTSLNSIKPTSLQSILRQSPLPPPRAICLVGNPQ